jgi:opacity protein-like surface antigen
MKKLILLSAIFAATVFTTRAQGTYMGLGFNYGFPAAGNALGTIDTRDNPANTSSSENVRGSFGTGFSLGYYVGYMMNSNFGFEINANYLWGSKYNFSSNTAQGNGNYHNTTDEVSAITFRISPALRMTFGDGKLRPYLRAGLTFGLFNKIIDNSVQTDMNSSSNGPDVTEMKFELTKGNSFGFTGAFGAGFAVNDAFSIFGEVTNFSSSWGPEKGEIVKATLNGNDILSTMDVSDKQFEFVDKVNYPSGSNSTPTQALKTYFPMSSLGFTVGIHYFFGS